MKTSFSYKISQNYKLYFVVILLLSSVICSAGEKDGNTALSNYKINPGDVIAVTVWGELELSRTEILVRPDGMVSMPIIGEIQVGGKTIRDSQDILKKKLAKYLLDDPVVTVTVLGLSGNVIYVIGKVQRPGEFVMRRPIDVAQALAIAGGLTTFADQNSIKILRRNPNGVQKAIKYRHNKIEKGKNLYENIQLHAGDVIVVP